MRVNSKLGDADGPFGGGQPAMSSAITHDGDRPRVDLSRPLSVDTAISSLVRLQWEIDHVIRSAVDRLQTRSVAARARRYEANKDFMEDLRQWERKMARGDRPATDPPDLLEQRLRTPRS